VGKKSTMREVLSNLKSSPSKQKTRRLPPGTNDGVLIDRKGKAYKLSQKNVSPEESSRIVKSGAQVIFDECGCGGVCGFVYASQQELSLMSTKTPVIKTHKDLTGSLSVWKSDSGETVLLAEGPIDWV
jgi:hypothetical protein